MIEGEGMRQALAQAEQAALRDEVPVGAVIFDPATGQVVGRGHNLREARQDPLAHAEILAIREAAERLGSWRLSDCVLFVTLEPCPMCLAACQQARIARIEYGAADLKGGALSLGYRLHEDGRTHHRFAVELRPEPRCGGILTEFFARKRRAAKTDPA